MGRLKRAIVSTYNPCSCNVRTGYENRRWFDVIMGVKQGSVLLPLLFIAYMDVIYKQVQRANGDVMVYADDKACWSNSRQQLDQGLNCWKRCFDEARMSINVQKTEILTIRNGGHRYRGRSGDRGKVG